MKKKFLIGSFLFLISSCSYLNIPNSNEGLAYFKINFPSKSSFKIKAIPKTTEIIKISISGEGLDNPKILELTREENSVTVTKLPEGKKIIEVLALNSKRMVVAEAKADVTIEKAKIKTVEIELKPTEIYDFDPNSLLEKLEISLKNMPDNLNFLLQIKKNNFELNQEFKGNKIVLNNVPKGKVSLKVSASENQTNYLFNSEVDLQNEKLEIDVQKIDLQSELDKLVDNNISNSDSININLQEKVSDLLNKVIIPVKNNNKPFIDSINITVNDTPKTFGLLKPICLNKNDKLRIAITASDKDNDKLTYSWGVTQMKNGDLSNPQYTTMIERNSSNVFEKVVNFNKGNVFIGFSITDKKSFVYTTIPFFVSDVKCD